MRWFTDITRNEIIGKFHVVKGAVKGLHSILSKFSRFEDSYDLDLIKYSHYSL